MRTDRVILRAFLTTLISIFCLFGVMLLLLCILFPATVMQLTYDLGMDKSSVKYAARAYDRTDDVYYAAFALETSILIEDDKSAERIEEYGLLLIADDEFETYSQYRNDLISDGNDETDEQAKVTLPYQQYVYGQVTIAQYAQGKKTEAIDTAFAGLDGTFPESNAAAILYLTALQADDETTVATMKPMIVSIMNELEPTSADYQYAATLLAIEKE